MLRIVGVVLLVLGLAGLAVGSFDLDRDKTVVDVGPLQVRARTKDKVVIPPLVAGGVAVLGAIVTMASLKKR